MPMIKVTSSGPSGPAMIQAAQHEARTMQSGVALPRRGTRETNENGLADPWAQEGLVEPEGQGAGEQTEKDVLENAALLGVAVLDLDGKVQDWNEGAEAITGYPSRDVIGHDASFLFGGNQEQRSQMTAHLKLAQENGRHETSGPRLRRDHSEFLARVALSALRDASGACVGFAVAVRDLTGEQRIRERMSARETWLAAALAEREVLLQEIHHRVKNNLQVIVSLVNMQRRATMDASSREALAECASRVQAIALIHEKLYQSEDFSKIPFFEYARRLARNVFSASGCYGCDIELKLSVEPVSLPVDRAIPCALVLNELISNALRHGFPDGDKGVIEVVLERTPEVLRLGVRNDGCPLPDQFTLGGRRTLGLQLLSTLTDQLEGKLTFERDPMTAFWLEFPEGT